MNKIQKIDPVFFDFDVYKASQMEASSIWDIFKRRYSTKTTFKKNSRLMSAVGSILPGNKDNFMDRVTTTIGKTIYLCNDFPNLLPVQKILLAIHEHFHVVNKVGISYILSKNSRAKEETRVYTATEIFRKPSIRSFYLETCKFENQLYMTSKYDSKYCDSKANIIYNLYKAKFTNEDYVNDTIKILKEVLL